MRGRQAHRRYIFVAIRDRTKLQQLFFELFAPGLLVAPQALVVDYRHEGGSFHIPGFGVGGRNAGHPAFKSVVRNGRLAYIHLPRIAPSQAYGRQPG